MKHSNRWIGGRIKRGKYWYIFKPEHPFSGKQGYIAEHRLIMEKYLGRYLSKLEVIHHINHNEEDNRIENLELCESPGQHIIKHHPEVKEKLRLANIGRRPPNYNRGIKICSICKISFETRLSKTGKIFCSRYCFHQFQKGKRISIKSEFKKGQKAWNKGIKRYW